MAHYAMIDKNNIVVQVITGVDENIAQVDLDGTVVGGSSEAWETFYASRPWFAGLTCKRTSYNNRIRKQYAGIGYFYDEAADVFVAPQPFPSWTLDANHDWQPPTPYPQDGKRYQWIEEDLNWQVIEQES
jgi:hypothetical protein